MALQSNGALSLHLGFCGALNDAANHRYLPCSNHADPAIDEKPFKPAVDGSSVDAGGNRNALFDPNMKERKDEIDALRARVDLILNKMVQNSGDDVQRLRQKIAEMRTNPGAALPPTTKPSKLWGTAEAMGCPLSPMTAITNASATPSADTEPHANLTSKKKGSAPVPMTPTSEGSASVLAVEERDDDDDIDNMDFDFKVAPLSFSKSVQMNELDSIGDSKAGKESKDPPASLKKTESMLPDPRGDASYCSGSSRCESPPPGSLLYEAAARKAESVVDRENKEMKKKQQGENNIEQKKKAAPKPEDKKKAISATKSEEKSHKTQSLKSLSVKETPVVVKSGSGKSNDPPAAPSAQRQKVEVGKVERSKSPPPPVVNVNIPNKGDSNRHFSDHILSPSHSDSSLTRPPSTSSPVAEITMVEEVTEQRIRDPYGDKGLYTGVLVKRRPHGRGTMKYDDGRYYEGHWNHGRWHGVGRAIFANHDIFEGSYDMDQRHGHGMYQWNDGRVYTGQFFQDQRQGRGTYTWPDGAVYQGEFKAGHRHGQGMYRFADGSVYTGEWENGKYHGVGECRWSDGRSYRGEWKDGRANGYGVETRPNGTIRHDGEWKDDRPIRESKRNAQGELNIRP